MHTTQHAERRGSAKLFHLAVILLSQSTVHAQDLEHTLETGKEAMAAFHEACAADDGATWGITLCGRLVLIDPESRLAVANQADPGETFIEHDGLFVGRAPTTLGAANTSVSWGAETWATVIFPVPGDAYDAAELLCHESFHRIQGEVGVVAADVASAHLGEREGRTWLRLELRALATSLAAESDADALTALRDAVAFRMSRYRAYPEARHDEAQLEMAEGLAAYTGARLAQPLAEDGIARVVKLIRQYDDKDAYARSFAYGTGPAVGMALDRLASDGWRQRVVAAGEFTGELLATAGESEIVTAPDALAARESSYDGADLRAEEIEREVTRDKVLADYRAKLVDGPVLVLKQPSLSRSFNPSNLVPFGDLGTIYPTGNFGAAWGSLEVVPGGAALIAPDFTTLCLAAPSAGGDATITGDGWTLELETGWEVVVLPDGQAELRQVDGR